MCQHGHARRCIGGSTRKNHERIVPSSGCSSHIGS